MVNRSCLKLQVPCLQPKRRFTSQTGCEYSCSYIRAFTCDDHLPDSICVEETSNKGHFGKPAVFAVALSFKFSFKNQCTMISI